MSTIKAIDGLFDNMTASVLKHFTLEKDVLKELTGLRHSYGAVLTANKKRDLRYI